MRISSRMHYDTKTVKMFRSANIGRLNLYITIANYVKLWPWFKTPRWPSCGVMATYNNIRICPSLTVWPTVTGVQHHKIYCSSEVGMTCKNNYFVVLVVFCAFRHVRSIRVWLSQNIIYQVQNKEISLSDHQVLFLWLCVSDISLWLVLVEHIAGEKKVSPCTTTTPTLLHNINLKQSWESCFSLEYSYFQIVVWGTEIFYWLSCYLPFLFILLPKTLSHSTVASFISLS